MNLKIEELISAIMWKMAYIDGKPGDESNATEEEKNVVRKFRKFTSITVERFNEFYSVKTDDLIDMLEKQDPVTKILAYAGSFLVAYIEDEDGEFYKFGQLPSKKEIELIVKIRRAGGFSTKVKDKIKQQALKLFQEIIEDRKIEREIYIESGHLGKNYIDALLMAFFNAIEDEGDLLNWEQNYLALKRNKRALTRLFGEFSIAKLDATYNDLKFNIAESKEEAKKMSIIDKEAKKIVEQLKREKEKEAKLLEKERLKKEKEDEKKAKEIAKIAEKEKMNKTHDISISNGVKYCKYCGDTDGFGVDCNRELGHKYTVKRVITTYGTEYKPVCSRCGIENWCWKYKCG